MGPGHREPLDQLFKRWLDFLFYPLSKAVRTYSVPAQHPASGTGHSITKFWSHAYFSREHMHPSHMYHFARSSQLCSGIAQAVAAQERAASNSNTHLHMLQPERRSRPMLKAHVVATALLAREHRLLGVVPPNSSAWPGVCGMARSTCVRRCESDVELTIPFQRWSQVSRSTYFRWPKDSWKETFCTSFHFSGTNRLDRRQLFRPSVILIISHTPRAPQPSLSPCPAIQSGHSQVRHRHSCARLGSPASLPCLNPALPTAALITLLLARRPPCLLS
jgi:hypothetical protein